MSLDEKTAAAPAAEPHRRTPVPRWLLGVGPLVLIAILLGLFSLLNAPGLSKLSEGVPPKEEVAVEDIRLTPGQIAITVRNEGPDRVSIAQVNVSDYYALFTQTRETMAPLESTTLTISYNWVEGDPYEVALVTSLGGKIPADIEAAALSPERGSSFFGLMTLLGVYVGVIPVALGMLWMPFVRRAPASWVRVLLGVTVGLLKTAYGWGLRRDELRHLSLVDFSRNVKAPYFGDYGILRVRFGKPQKGSPKKQRSVLTLLDWAAEAVDDWVKRGLPRYGQPVGDLFPTDRGGLVPEKNLRARMRGFLDELGFPPGLDLHSLRRSYVTHMQTEHGYDTKFISMQVGHEHTSTTTIYTLPSPDYAARELERVLNSTLLASNSRVLTKPTTPSGKTPR
ncbi:tyrosine-type recombinase/integrase [Pseudarthrobacter oxydans]|uniref:tyrosine-type recombinase/integrase n=1 Tax=Pseudarthrobacter oxydans TaxID=1671 RepID=UPI0034160749